MIFNPTHQGRKIRSFTLSPNFLKAFEGKQPDWGDLAYFTYKRTYSAPLDPNGGPDGPTEEFWQTCKRVVEGMMTIQKTHCKQMGLPWDNAKAQRSAQKIFTLMWEFKFTPPGRGLAKMGTDFVFEKGSAALNNCFGAETRIWVQRKEDVLPSLEYIGDVAHEFQHGGNLKVLTRDGSVQPATAHSFGVQSLNLVTFSVYKSHTPMFTVQATANHRWFLDSGEVTTDLKVGDKITVDPAIYVKKAPEDLDVFARGAVYGSGKCHERYINQAYLDLKTESLKKHQELLEGAPCYVKTTFVRESKCTRLWFEMDPSQGLWSERPNFSPSFMCEFFRGWFETKVRYKGKRCLISVKDPVDIEWVQQNAPFLGYTFRSCVEEPFVKTGLHVIALHQGPTQYIVSSIEPQEDPEEVFCLKVPSNQSFVLEYGIPTGNCAFISTELLEQSFSYPFTFLMDMSMLGVGVGADTKGAGTMNIVQPKTTKEVHVVEDSREGWVEITRTVLESFAGKASFPSQIDFSQVRAKGEPIKGFGGTASGSGPLVSMLQQTIQLLGFQTNLRVDKPTSQELSALMNRYPNDKVSVDVTVYQDEVPVLSWEETYDTNTRELVFLRTEFLKEVSTRLVTSTDIVDIFNMIGACVVAGGIRRCLPKGSLVHTSEGLVPIEKVSVGSQVLTSKGWSDVTDWMDQGVQSLSSVHTQMGDFEATANHRVAVITDTKGGYGFKKVSELVAGDRMVFVDQMVEGQKSSLPSFSYTKPKHSTTCKDISIPELDEDMAWFFGQLAGDGYVLCKKDSGQVSMACAGDNLLTRDRLQKVLERFGVNIYQIDPTAKDNSYKLRVKSKQLASYLSAFKQANTVLQIPPFILQGSSSQRAAYLAGLFDADGSYKTRPLLLASSVYPSFLKEAQAVAASLGIPTRLKETRKAKGNWQTLYSLHVVGTKARQTFQDLVSPHLSYFEDSRKTSRSGHDYGFPSEMVRADKVSRSKDGKVLWSSSSRQMTVARFEQLSGREVSLVPVEVLGVTHNVRESQTYDISVEAREFVCEGYLVHNSAEILFGEEGDVEFRKLKDPTELNALSSRMYMLKTAQEGSNDSSPKERIDFAEKHGFTLSEADLNLLSGGLGGEDLVSSNAFKTFLQEEVDRLDGLIQNHPLRTHRWCSNNSIFASIGMDYTEVAESIAKNGEPGLLWLDAARAHSRMIDPPDHKDRKAMGANPCFTGDTLVHVYKRGPVPIETLAKEGVDVPVYTVDPVTRQYTIAWGRNPRKTGEQCPVKVTFDDGSSITVTRDHKIPLVSGMFVEAQNLKEGDVLYGFDETMREKSTSYLDGCSHLDTDDPVFQFSLEQAKRMVPSTGDAVPEYTEKRRKRLLGESRRSTLQTLWSDNRLFVARSCENCNQSFATPWEMRGQSYCSEHCKDQKEGERRERPTDRNVQAKEGQEERLQSQVDVFAEIHAQKGEVSMTDWKGLCMDRGIPSTFKNLSRATPHAVYNLDQLETMALHSTRKVVSIALVRGSCPVYNLSVEGTHTVALVTDQESLSGVYLYQCSEQTLESAELCCVSGDTRILTKDGYPRISDVVGEEVEVWNGEEWSKVTPFIAAQNKDLYRVHLSDGSYLDCTDDHKWEVQRPTKGIYRQVETKDLTKGHKAISFGADSFEGNHEEYAFEWGFFTGDGYLDKKEVMVSLHGPKRNLKTKLRGSLRKEQHPENYSEPFQRMSLTSVLRDQHQDYLTRGSDLNSKVEGLPSWVFEMDKDSTLRFVAGWVEADGSVASQKTTDNYRIFGTELKMRDLQMVLRRVGINHATVYLMASAGEVLTIQGKQIKRNHDLWVCLIPSYECSLLSSYCFLKKAMRFGSRMAVNNAHPEGAKIDRARKQKVVSVERLEGKHTTYCFTEPIRHMGVFGNVLTFQCLVENYPAHHNTLDEFLRTLKFSYLYAKTVTLLPTHNPRTNAVIARNRRIGCSMSGIRQAIEKLGRREFLRWCDEGYKYLKDLDKQYSDWLGVPRSIKMTSIKPSGTVSLLSQATPGIHAGHSPYYIRNVRLNEKSPLLEIVREAGYTVEKDAYASNTFVVSFPIKLENCTKGKKDYSMWEQVALAVAIQRHWADNQVSCLVGDTKIATNEGDITLKALASKACRGIEASPPQGGYVVLPYKGDLKVSNAYGTFSEFTSITINAPRPLREVQFSNGMVLTGTTDHKILVKDRGWVSFNLLEVGDMVCLGGGISHTRVSSIGDVSKDVTYDLTVTDGSSYIANGIASHNCTVTFNPEEASQIKDVLEAFEDQLKSISFLPNNDHGYVQAPYIEITKEQFEDMVSVLKPLNLSGAQREVEDNFCTTDACEIRSFNSDAT